MAKGSLRHIVGIILCGFGLGFAAPVAAQDATLPMDAEHYGALIAAGPVFFQRNGALGRGTLKISYVRDGLTYQAGTAIEFGSDGRVLAGQLAAAVAFPGREDLRLVPGPIRFYPNGSIQSANLGTGSRDLNVTLPVDMNVNFTTDGRFSTMQPTGIAGLSYPFRGMTMRNGQVVVFVFDRIQQTYVLTRGMVGAPQLVGHLVTARSSPFQLPTTVLPVVVPTLSTFTFHSRSRDYAADQSPYDEWYYEGTFAINNYNFGLRPRLLMREGRLAAIQLSQAMTVDGVAYPTGAVILLNELGRIIK